MEGGAETQTAAAAPPGTGKKCGDIGGNCQKVRWAKNEKKSSKRIIPKRLFL